MPDVNIEGIFDTATLTLTELILAGIILIGSILLARLIRRAIRSSLGTRPSLAPHVPELIGRLSSWAVVLIGIVAALIVLGFQMGPVVLLLLLLAGMAAISGRRILENWASGLFLQILAPFTVGDRIETEGITGWVEEINSREVVLTSQDRRTVRIPNAKVANSVLYNYTDDEQRRSQIGFSVGYDQDVNAAKMVATEAVSRRTRPQRPRPSRLYRRTRGRWVRLPDALLSQRQRPDHSPGPSRTGHSYRIGRSRNQHANSRTDHLPITNR